MVLPIEKNSGLDLTKLSVRDNDTETRKFLMIIEGVYGFGVKNAIKKYGYTEQRYYQLLKLLRLKGIKGLINKKTGPTKKKVLTTKVIKKIVHLRFLNSELSALQITRQINAEGYKISVGSVEKTIRDYGLYKKPKEIDPVKKNE